MFGLFGDGWIKDLVNGLINGVINWITSGSMAALNWVLSLLNNDVFHSPDMSSLPQVMYMSSRAQLAANAAMTLVVMIVGLIAMTHGTPQDRQSLKEMLPRVVIGYAMANMAGPIFRLVIGAGNAVTAALGGGTFNDQDSFNAIKRTVTDVTSDPVSAIMALVLRELALWMLVFVVVTWLGRLSVLLIVAATAPAALVCHAIPFAEPVARIWWKSLLSCLAVQILQAVTLHMAVASLLVPSANLPALGLPHDPTGLFNMLITCFLLWMVIKIPKWVTRNFGGATSRAGSVLGSIVRLVVVQQLLGAVGLRGGGKLLGRRAGAAAPAGAAGGGFRPPSPHFHQHAATQHQHLHMHMHPPRANAPSGGGRRPPFQAGDVTPPSRSQPGRPSPAMSRPALPAGQPRRAIGPGPSAPEGR
jgi:hypothetical protein